MLSKAVTPYGDMSVATVLERIAALRRRGALDRHTVVNMSFGGYADERMDALERGIRGIRRDGAVVVASAGNDATTRPSFPACLPDVVGVAALDRYGPAQYPNHGDWVRACAPGTDLVSGFSDFNGGLLPPMPGGPDPDDFAQ